MKTTEILHNPTVNDLINTLMALPAHVPIKICDADTSWIGSIIHIDKYPKNVYLRIEYNEMDCKGECE